MKVLFVIFLTTTLKLAYADDHKGSSNDHLVFSNPTLVSGTQLSLGAVYRFNLYNWNYDQVYAEMKKFDFYTRWGHGDMKKFVQDYAANWLTRQANATITTSTANQK